jgi:hypothetical protein
MDIFVFISGFLQNFLGIGQLEGDEVLLEGLLGGRVGVWEGFVCSKNGGIDISVSCGPVSALPQQKPVHATGPGLSYHTICDHICNLYDIIQRCYAN